MHNTRMNRYEGYMWYKEYMATHVNVLYVQCIHTHTSIIHMHTYVYLVPKSI